MKMLVIDDREIRRQGPGNILGVCWRQRRAERRLARRGIHFRNTNLEDVAAAYGAMTEMEFAAINGRQDWANWRTIPRAMSGQVPDRPLRVVDLGCGTGSSTRVLAHYAPPGTTLTGYEIAQPLLALARRRAYHHRDGQVAKVHFVCQAVTTTLRQPDGTALADASVDVVNASGVVGHHLTADMVRPLIQELCRLVVPGGIAMLDVGPTLSGPELTILMEEAGFLFRGHYRSSWLDPTGEMVFRRNR